MPFISVEECIRTLVGQATIAKTNTTKTHILNAKDKILATDVVADLDVPPADNSPMDGYALRSADVQTSKTLAISQRIQAGDVAKPLEKNTAARIFTGAEIPKGADTVEIQENCSADQKSVTFNEKVAAGMNIRRQGQDIAIGSVVVKKGQRLRAQELGLLASIGVKHVETYQPLKIAIVNTGNELVEPGQPLKTGQIYNSNRYLINAILSGWGFHIEHCDIVADSLIETKSALAKISQTNDIVISSGGVSVGEEDHIKPAVDALGAINLWKVAIKPGKPFAFGHIANTAFIGLPGNPASVFVTLLVLARPYLLKQQGIGENDLAINSHTAIANFERKASHREDYLRARYQAGKVDIFPNQSSGVLTSASWGNCFVKQTIGEEIKLNQPVTILLYSDLFN